jgi:SSS family solute:Na+ symporter
MVGSLFGGENPVVLQSLFTTEGYIVIAYIIAIFGIGVLGARKTKSFRDYFSTSSSLGLIILIGTVLATQWGGVTLLGIVGFGYLDVWYGAWYSLGAAVRFMFWALLMALVLRKVNPFSISEWFGLRFDNKNALVMTVLNLVVSLGLLGAQFLAFGTVVSVFFDVGLQNAVIAGAVVVTVYTIIGGMWGVAYTDFVQVAITATAAVGMVLYLWATQGNISSLEGSGVYPEHFFDAATIAPIGDLNMGWLFFLTLIFLWFADLFLNHNMQRMVSAKNLKVAYWAPIFGAMSYILIAYVSPAIGAYGRTILGTGLESPDQVFPMLAQELLPAYIAGLVAAALLAVVMSSGDSYLLGPSTLAANDLYRAFNPDASEERVLRVARLITLAFAAITLYSALFFDTIIGLILTYLTIGWAVIPALGASVAWRRTTSNASFWSMAVGGAVNAFLMLNQSYGWIGSINAAFPDMPAYYVGWIGFALALIILVVGSLIEGESGVPDNVTQPVVTDGGEVDEMEARADAALRQVQY